MDPTESRGGLAKVALVSGSPEIALVPRHFAGRGFRLPSIQKNVVEGFPGRLQVVLDLHGRGYLSGPVVEEAVWGKRVVGQFVRVVHTKAQQVGHGMLVLRTVEAPHDKRTLRPLHFLEGL